MGSEEVIVMHPIGIVQNKLKKGKCPVSWKNTVSEIRLDEKFAEGLSNIDEYSHIVVVFWMHQVPDELRDKMLVNVPYAPAKNTPRGIFATRIPERPNPIGISVVTLVKRDNNIILVKDLDAFDGTPILDIKPFTGHVLEHISCFGIPYWERNVEIRGGHK